MRDGGDVAELALARLNARSARSKTRKNAIAKWRLIERAVNDAGGDCCDSETGSSNQSNCSDYDETRTRAAIVAMTEPSQLVAILCYMHSERYSRNYMLSVWKTIGALNKLATRTLFTETLSILNDDDDNEDEEGSRRRRRANDVSRKSDGRLAFSEQEFTALLLSVNDQLRSANTVGDARVLCSISFQRHCLFLYVFYMLAVTGKRLSDIAGLDVSQLRQLCKRGVCIVHVRKTDTLGRIEIPELLGDAGSATASAVPLAPSVIRQHLEQFLRWSEQGVLCIPFARDKHRRDLDERLRTLYESVCGCTKSRGLSFHALRRAYAGFRFLHGVGVERLRENLDHSTRSQTNRYVNNCLLELL